ncbi:MAG: response regulator transcription factor [Propionibacteriaceae bacterium]|nr:response regulator transcription factor [Propionibacteriaceae bacterium]
MAQILLVSPANRTPSAIPAALEMLSHDVVSVAGADRVLGYKGVVDLVIVDGRGDLPDARTITGLIVDNTQYHVMLLVPVASLPVLNSKWGIEDFVVDTATATELDARIRLMLEVRASGASSLVAGQIAINEDAYTVAARGRSIDLTYTEFELLKYMVQHPGRVLSREQLLTDVWGYDYFGGTRTVDVHIRRLRAKLGSELEHYITTVRNVGYRFSPERPA